MVIGDSGKAPTFHLFSMGMSECGAGVLVQMMAEADLHPAQDCAACQEQLGGLTSPEIGDDFGVCKLSIL